MFIKEGTNIIHAITKKYEVVKDFTFTENLQLDTGFLC